MRYNAKNEPVALYLGSLACAPTTAFVASVNALWHAKERCTGNPADSSGLAHDPTTAVEATDDCI